MYNCVDPDERLGELIMGDIGYFHHLDAISIRSISGLEMVRLRATRCTTVRVQLVSATN
jgi:hypothetical protein